MRWEYPANCDDAPTPTPPSPPAAATIAPTPTPPSPAGAATPRGPSDLLAAIREGYKLNEVPKTWPKKKPQTSNVGRGADHNVDEMIQRAMRDRRAKTAGSPCDDKSGSDDKSDDEFTD